MTQSQVLVDPAVSPYDAAALRLRQAYSSGAIEPLRDVLEPTDVAGAYAIQQINTRFWLAEGRRIVGRKIGLTAEAVQKQLGVDRPDYGVLFADAAVADGGGAGGRAADPAQGGGRGRDRHGTRPDPRPTPRTKTCAAAAECAVAAIEIVDSRIADWRITFADTVADNGSAAFFVLGRSARRLRVSTCAPAAWRWS